MKKNIVSMLAIFVVAALVLLSSSYSVAQDKKVPTKKELITLLKTAKEPPEHRRIAAYYRQEEARQTQNAKEHAELAAYYEQNHPFPAMESKHGDAFGLGSRHCKKFAALAAERATNAHALAAMHEDMAKAAEKN